MRRCILLSHMSAFDLPDVPPSLHLTSQSSADSAAQCLDCDAGHAAKNAAVWAHNHARVTGHSVALSFGYIVRLISNRLE